MIDIFVSVAVVMALLSSVKLYHTLFLHEEWIINFCFLMSRILA